jgi:adenine-specific DNA-methyltransferase
VATSPGFSVHRKMEDSPEVAVHGQVATKPHVVGLILDLVGYTEDRPLGSVGLLDPGCGEGAFIAEAARRLVKSLGGPLEPGAIAGCLLGLEKDKRAAEICRGRVAAVLADAGLSPLQASRLARRWIVCGDYLEHRFERTFRYVVGNPPYVRQEAIPKDQLLRYRRDFECFYDRADLYVAFFERSLRLLDEKGVLGFICPDRFTRNNYGRKLRRLITSEYSVKAMLDLTQASPFEPEVICYPGIFVVARGRSRGVDYFRLSAASPGECRAALEIVRGRSVPETTSPAVVYHHFEEWFTGEEKWTTESPAHLDLLRRLERDHVPLGSEASGCRVGIGVATGADRVFIVRPGAVDIEPELLMPLVMTDDIATGEVRWSGRCVINPFRSESSPELIDLGKYPRARRYFLEHEETLKARNIARRNDANQRHSWYRTIDRIYPSLRATPKLLIPDIKVSNLIVLEEGKLYPHHNLYYVASESWDLAALRTILRSSVARFFVWMYGVKMRANFLRFQAQYLRRVCIPLRLEVGSAMMAALRAVPPAAPIEEVDVVVARLYGLTAGEMDLIRDIAG